MSIRSIITVDILYWRSVFVFVLVIFVSSCATQKTPSPKPVEEIPPRPVKTVKPVKKIKKRTVLEKKFQKKDGTRLCENIRSLKKGMTLKEVHNRLGIEDDSKHAFTKPVFYVKCYEADMMISYAGFKFYFNEGCTFRKYYEPAEEEMKEMICSGKAGELGPPILFRY